MKYFHSLFNSLLKSIMLFLDSSSLMQSVDDISSPSCAVEDFEEEKLWFGAKSTKIIFQSHIL